MAERLKRIISERRLRARTAVLAHQIEADYHGQPLSLVVVLKGAVIFAADLIRQINIPFTVDFIAASSYGADTRSSGTITLGGIDGFALAGRQVLVIEDILDTGLTGATILDRLRQLGPAGLAMCALLRKPAATALDLLVAYVGFDIPQDFVVGWGMDYAERYRSLRGVYRLLLDISTMPTRAPQT